MPMDYDESNESYSTLLGDPVEETGAGGSFLAMAMVGQKLILKILPQVVFFETLQIK